MSLPVVAIVGRPNVGKSALFNKLTGERFSIVDDKPGVTRDRIYGQCEWLGNKFTLIDTGGIESKTDDLLLQLMKKQTDIAINSADLIIFLCNVRDGLTAADIDVAAEIRKSGKPVILAVNKVDSIGELPSEYYEFYNLGLGEPIPVSSVHGHGTGDLLEEIFRHISSEYDDVVDEELIKVAIIGKPNVGKSSFINYVSGENRMLVSDIAGTTRDATDTIVHTKNGNFILIDTAGLRRKSKVKESIEKYSVMRSEMAVERADVCVIMIDALEGFTEQDSKVAGLAHELGKGCIIAVNKWDAVEKDGKTMDNMRKKLMKDFSFMSYAPIVFISAKNGTRIDKLFEIVKLVNNQNCMRIGTGKLNEILTDAMMRVQPPTDKGKRLKIYYITQVSTRPPTFVCFVNRKELFHYSYQRYIDNSIRDVFGLNGTPTRYVIRERNCTDD